MKISESVPFFYFLVYITVQVKLRTFWYLVQIFYKKKKFKFRLFRV